MTVRELPQLWKHVYYRLGFTYVHVSYPMYARRFLWDGNGRSYELLQECNAILIDNRNLNRLIILF